MKEICFLELIRVSEMQKQKTRNLFLIIKNTGENCKHILFDLWKCQEHKPVLWDLEAWVWFQVTTHLFAEVLKVKMKSYDNLFPGFILFQVG
jgi:hypothetical protein